MARFSSAFLVVIIIVVAMLVSQCVKAPVISIGATPTAQPSPTPMATPMPDLTQTSSSWDVFGPTPVAGLIHTKYGYNTTIPNETGTTIQSKNTEQLSTPVLSLPADGEKYSHYPRNTILVWSPVTYADQYKVEVEMGSHNRTSGRIDWQGAQSYRVPEATYIFTIDGPLSCRWRVTAYDTTGKHIPSQPSDWYTLLYTA